MNILDLVNDAKKKTEETMSRGGGGGVGAKFWRPGPGANNIRIMPSWTDETPQFWRQAAQHWNVSEDLKGPMTCPKQTPDIEGDDCPICDFVTDLREDKTNVEAQELAKEIRAKKVYFLNVVDLKDPMYTVEDVAKFKEGSPDRDVPFEVGTTKVQVYAAPVSIMDEIFGLIQNAKKDITGLEDGRGIMIKKIPNKDPKKTRYQVLPDFDPSKLETENLSLIDLSGVGFRFTPAEMTEHLEGGVGDDFPELLEAGKAAKKLPKGGASQKKSSSMDLDEQIRKELGK